MNNGKLVTVGILALALTAGAFAWTYHRGKSDRAIDYWGAENAVLIRRAPRVTLSRLAPSESADLVIDGDNWAVSDERDITQARGLVHLRQALVQNSSLDLAAENLASTRWEYLFRFQDGPRETQVAVALDAARLKCLDGRPCVGLKITEGVRSFVGDIESDKSDMSDV